MTQVTLFPKTDFSIFPQEALIDIRIRLVEALDSVTREVTDRNKYRVFICLSSGTDTSEAYKFIHNGGRIVTCCNPVERAIKNSFSGLIGSNEAAIEQWLAKKFESEGLIDEVDLIHSDSPEVRLVVMQHVFGIKLLSGVINEPNINTYDSTYYEANRLGNKYRLLWIPRMIAEVDALIELSKEKQNETVL